MPSHFWYTDVTDPYYVFDTASRIGSVHIIRFSPDFCRMPIQMLSQVILKVIQYDG